MDNEDLRNIIFTPGYRLEMPRLLFKGGAPAVTLYFGLVSYGPYMYPSSPPSNIVILHPDNTEFKFLAEKILNAFKEGYYGFFPKGFSDIFEIDVEFELQKVPNYDLYNYKSTAKEFYDIFTHEFPDTDNYFPILLMNKVPKGLYESLYTEVKYLFSTNGIPTQVVTYETFSDTEAFKWSIFPLALQVFVKMGGTPFILYDRLEVPNDEAIVIVGLGISRIRLPNRERKYVGFALTFSVEGRWRLIKWSSHPYSKEGLAIMLHKLIYDVVENVIKTYAIQKLKRIHVIIHYSGKNVSVGEEEYLKSAALDLKEIRNIEVIPYIVKIQESMYRIYDEENPCPGRDGIPTYLTSVGTIIKLKKDLYLLNTTGCASVQTIHGRIFNKPNAQGSPAPLLISIKRLIRDSQHLDDIELIKSVYYMARMNYASVNNPISKLPISIKYSKLLAYVSEKIIRKNFEENMDINSIIPDKLRKKLWFI